MIPAMIVNLLLTAIEESPEIFSEAQTLFQAIGGSDGGVAKLQKAASSLLQLAGHAASASVVAATPKPILTSENPAPPPPPPPPFPSVADTLVISGGTATENPAAILNAADRAALAAQSGTA